MANDPRKRILAISLEGGRRAQALAAWDGERLIVTDIREISGNPDEWLPVMLADIEAKVERGWVVMVEDRTGSFPSKATAYNFDALGPDGRTHLQSVLDWYFALDGRGALIIDPAFGRYALRLGGENDIVVRKTDEKGRILYDARWENVSAGHKALLMCVAGAVMEEPLSERWMRVFAGSAKPVEDPPIWPAFRAMRRLYEAQGAGFERRVDALEARKHV